MIQEQIKRLRLERNMNQEDVAKAINITKSTYIKYEKGNQSPQVETLEKLASFYGVTLRELIEEEEPNLDIRLGKKLQLINQLEEKEKESVILMIEGLIFRRQNIELSKKLS